MDEDKAIEGPWSAPLMVSGEIRQGVIDVEHDGEVVWFPRSHIADGGEYRRGQEGVTISFTDWILGQ